MDFFKQLGGITKNLFFPGAGFVDLFSKYLKPASSTIPQGTPSTQPNQKAPIVVTSNQANDKIQNAKTIVPASNLPSGGTGDQTNPNTTGGSTNVPPGWDPETYANFKKANPGLEPNAEDTAAMQHAGDPLYQYQQSLGALDKDYVEAHKSFQGIVDQINNGSLPLNADDQGVLNSIQTTFNNAVIEQQKANESMVGAAREFANTTGLNIGSPTQAAGYINQAMTTGSQKIAELNALGQQKYYEMKQAIYDKDYKRIKESYDSYVETLDKRRQVLTDTYDKTYQATKDLRDYNLQVQKFNEEKKTNALQRAKLATDIEKNNLDIAKLKADTIDPGSMFPYGSTNYTKAVMLKSVKNGDKILSEAERVKLDKSFSSITQLQNINELMKNVSTGPLSGRLNKFITTLGGAPNAAALQAAINGLVPGIARGTFGEVGVLTDNDIKLYSRTTPNMVATGQQNKLVQAVLLKTIQSGIKDQLEVAAGSGLNVSGLTAKYDNVSKQILKIEDQIGVTKERVIDLVGDNPNIQPMAEQILADGGNYSDILIALGAY